MRRALTISVAVHVVLVIGILKFHPERAADDTELIDIDVAPPPPEAEALPEETARMEEEGSGSAADDEADKGSAAEEAAEKPNPNDYYRVDAGVEIDAAPPDAPIDAPVDAKPKPDAKPDAPIDATEPMIADADIDGGAEPTLDAGVEDAGAVATLDDGGDGGAIAAMTIDGGEGSAAAAGSGAGSDELATGSGSGTGSQGSLGSGSIAMENGSGSGKAGMTNEPAVEGAPTTAGTAANLLAYFPKGHTVTAMIRFDRLRGTEWAAQAERLLQPMPDYQVLFGASDADIVTKLDTLIISTPRPRDATATTLVGHTSMERAALRDFLSASTPITWAPAKGGLFGKRTGRTFKNDARVFLSPYKGWFFLAQPEDIKGLDAPSSGDLDTIEAKSKLPAWLAGMRKIEDESNGKEPKGPALVVTLGLSGERIDLQGNDFGMGVQTFPTPKRATITMERTKDGWLARGNLSFANEKDAKEFITDAELVKSGVGNSFIIKKVLGKPLVRVIDNLSFRRSGARMSYATSISIADARAILKALASQLDTYFNAPQP